MCTGAHKNSNNDTHLEFLSPLTENTTNYYKNKINSTNLTTARPRSSVDFVYDSAIQMLEIHITPETTDKYLNGFDRIKIGKESIRK